MKYDVIIIGSGLGGLICGHLLARAGRRVLILERQTQPGGCLQSYRRGAKVFDTGLHTVGGLAPGQPLHARFEQVGLMRLPWRRLDAEGYEQVTIGSETFVHAEGFDRFAETLIARFPGESDGIRRYVDLLQHQPSIQEAGEQCAYDSLRVLFHDPLLLDVIAAPMFKMELCRESLPLFHFLHVAAGYVQSSWRLCGDGGMLVQSLVDDLRHFGAEVICRAEVEELVERDGQIVAARCSNGETYEATTFVSDIHPKLTYDLIRDSVRIRRIQRWRMESLKNTVGMFTVSLVLKPQTVRYFNHNKYVYRRANVWEAPLQGKKAEEPIDRVMLSCRVPEEGIYTTQIDLLTPMPWAICQQWADTSVGHRGSDYLSMKRQRAQECINLAETVLPGLGDAIEQQYVSTPLTWRDYNLAPEGSAYGVRKDYRNMLMTTFSTQTQVPNLLLTGQNLVVHGLEGVTMTAFQTAEEILNPTK